MSLDLLASFELDHTSGLPVWIQIKNRLAYLVASGAYSAGERLPTVRALAVSLGISYNTVNRAYMDLEREGYISTHAGRGTFVADALTRAMPSASDTANVLFGEFIQAATSAGMNDADILDFVQRQLSQRKGGAERTAKVSPPRELNPPKQESDKKLVPLKKPVRKAQG